MFLFRFVFLAMIAVAGLAAVASFGDIRRYLKMRSM